MKNKVKTEELDNEKMRGINNLDIKQAIYRDANGILVPAYDSDFKPNKDAKAIVYINGSQLDHYKPNGSIIGINSFICKNVLKKQKVFNFGTFAPVLSDYGAFGHKGDLYDINHIPYVFKYIIEKDSDGVKQFSTSLKKALLQLQKEAILVGKSYGGVIASYAYEAPEVSKIMAINASYLGTPLADPDIMTKFKPYLPHIVSMIASKIILEADRNFTYENARGFEIPKTEKLNIYGGSIKNDKATNPNELLMKYGYETIYRITGKENDGVVIWDKELLEKSGNNVIELDRPFHHRTQQSEYLEETFVKTLKMKR